MNSDDALNMTTRPYTGKFTYRYIYINDRQHVTHQQLTSFFIEDNYPPYISKTFNVTKVTSNVSIWTKLKDFAWAFYDNNERLTLKIYEDEQHTLASEPTT